MFGFGRSSEAVVRDRADKVRILVAMISSNLYTMALADFVAFYKTTTRVEQHDSEIYFGVKLSPSCWYDVCAIYPQAEAAWMGDLLGPASDDSGRPSLCILGGGDDYGVFINSVGPDSGASVELHVAPGQRAGKDAKSIVTALLGFSGFRTPIDL
jgi:hypothetical protein